MEYQDYLDSLCSCGRPRHETFDPSSEGRYEATLLRCHACAERQGRLERFQKADNANTAGLYATVDMVDSED